LPFDMHFLLPPLTVLEGDGEVFGGVRWEVAVPDNVSSLEAAKLIVPALVANVSSLRSLFQLASRRYTRTLSKE